MPVLPIYVISLSRDYESRYVPLQKKLEGLEHCPSVHPRIHRVDAVYGRDLPPSIRRDYCQNPWHRFFITPSMLGCAASHLRAWRMIVDQDESPWVLVLEDDVVFDPDMLIRLHRDVLSEDTQKSDIIMVGSLDPTMHRMVNQNSHSIIPYYMTLPTTSDNTTTTDTHFFYTTSSYVISRRGAQRLLACLAGHLSYHVDLMIHGVCYRGLCRSRTLLEPIVWTRLDTPSHNDTGFPWLSTQVLCRVASPGVLNILNQPLLQLGTPRLTISVNVLLFFLVILSLIPRRFLIVAALWFIAEMVLTRRYAWPTLGIVMCMSIRRYPWMRRWWLILWLIIAVYTVCHLHYIVLGVFLPSVDDSL